ncbi:MAG: hypothetical protein AAF602_09305 [Myxococcota bacterium]
MDTPIVDPTPTSFGPGGLASAVYSGASIVAFAVFVAAFRTEGLEGAFRWGVGLGAPVVILVGTSLVLSPLGRRRRARQQALRDRRAAALLAAVERGPPSMDYALYLRSFATTGRLLGESPADFVQAGFDPRPDADRNLDLETLFATVLEPEAPLVALGKPGEHEGAGRVETGDEAWKDAFRRLAEPALLLLVVPTPGRSLEWEVRWVREHGHLSKCLFVMPPGKPSLSARFDWKPAWRAMRDDLKQHGIELPEHDHEGAMFFLGVDGRVVDRESLLGPDPKPRFVSYNLGQLLARIANRRTQDSAT